MYTEDRPTDDRPTTGLGLHYRTLGLSNPRINEPSDCGHGTMRINYSFGSLPLISVIIIAVLHIKLLRFSPTNAVGFLVLYDCSF